MTICSTEAATSFWTDVARQPIIGSRCKHLAWHAFPQNDEIYDFDYLMLPNLFNLSSLVRLSLTLVIRQSALQEALTDYIVNLPNLAHMELNLDIQSMKVIADRL